MTFDDPRAREIVQTALDHTEDAHKAIDRALTWIDLPAQQRDDYTRAANALELAACRIRGAFRDIKPVIDLL